MGEKEEWEDILAAEGHPFRPRTTRWNDLKEKGGLMDAVLVDDDRRGRLSNRTPPASFAGNKRAPHLDVVSVRIACPHSVFLSVAWPGKSFDRVAISRTLTPVSLPSFNDLLAKGLLGCCAGYFPTPPPPLS